MGAARENFSDAELSALLYAVALIQAWNTLNIAVELPPDAVLPKPELGISGAS